MQRSNWRPMRIWLNMSPEFDDITSHDRLGRSPCSSARRITGCPMPIWISVSGLEETLQSLSASLRKLRSSSVLQCTCTWSGPSSPWWSSSGIPSVIGEPQLQPVCSTVGTPSSCAERASAIVWSKGSRPDLGQRHAHRHQRVVRGQLAGADPARVGQALLVVGEHRLGRRSRVVAVGEQRADPRVAQTLKRARRRAPGCCCSARSRGSWSRPRPAPRAPRGGCRRTRPRPSSWARSWCGCRGSSPRGSSPRRRRGRATARCAGGCPRSRASPRARTRPAARRPRPPAAGSPPRSCRPRPARPRWAARRRRRPSTARSRRAAARVRSRRDHSLPVRPEEAHCR